MEEDAPAGRAAMLEQMTFEDQIVRFEPVDLYHSCAGFRRESVQIQGLDEEDLVSVDV